MAFWKAQHLPGLRLTANGTQNDKAEAGSIPVLTTKIKINKHMMSLILFLILGIMNYLFYRTHERNGDRNWANFSWFNIGLCFIQAFKALVEVLNNL